jgi:alanyl-tRNA synthetase
MTREKDAIMARTAAAMKLTDVSDLERRASQMAKELKAEEKKNEELNAELASLKAGDMLSDVLDLGAVKLIVNRVDGINGGDLRNMADDAAKTADVVAVLATVNGDKVNFACACGEAAVKAGAHAGNIVREVAKVAGGSGGGRPDSAMAGGKDVAKTDDAMAAAADIVKGMLH